MNEVYVVFAASSCMHSIVDYYLCDFCNVDENRHMLKSFCFHIHLQTDDFVDNLAKRIFQQ